METLAYTLQKFELGVVLLDANNKVQALNEFAHRILGHTQRGDLHGRTVYQVHPKKSHAKVELLLRSAEKAARQHQDSPSPVTMLISIPDKVLLIKVSKLLSAGRMVGTCMLFYDLTDITTPPQKDRGGKPNVLLKLPVYSQNQILLLDLADVTHIESDGHYTNVHTAAKNKHFCNLSLSDLEVRLDKSQFLRVHRSYVVNIRHARSIKKVRDRYHILVNGDETAHVPIARTKVRELKEMLGLA
jgi:DNA-binding LytR/AlgR family response regulator